MALYRKIPRVVEAMRIGIDHWEGHFWSAVCVNKIILFKCAEPDGYVLVKTDTGDAKGMHGDWLIRGITGEIYPCTDEVFQKTYEKVLSDADS